MANSYQQCSEYLALESAEEVEWVRRYLRPFQEVDGEDDECRARSFNLWCKERGIVDLDAYDAAECWPSFSWEIEERAGDTNPMLWVHIDESGYIEEVVNLVTQYFKTFKKRDACWSITWADFCSKPRVGEFGGGAAFVTIKGVNWSNTYDWVDRQRKRWYSRKEKANGSRLSGHRSSR
jgi:hypothetical protein